MGEFASFIAAEVCRVGFVPRAEAAITEIAIPATIVRASHSISRIFVGKGLLALRAALKVLSRIIFSQGQLKVPPFLGSEDSDLLAGCIVPFKAALCSSFDFKGTLDLSLSLRDNCPNMRSNASLPDAVSAWPLVSKLLAVDWVLDIVDLQLGDLAERYSILLKDQFISDDHIKIAKLGIIGKFGSLISKSHFLRPKLLGKLLVNKFFQLEASSLSRDLKHILLLSDIDDLESDYFSLCFVLVHHTQYYIITLSTNFLKH